MFFYSTYSKCHETHHINLSWSFLFQDRAAKQTYLNNLLHYFLFKHNMTKLKDTNLLFKIINIKE